MSEPIGGRGKPERVILPANFPRLSRRAQSRIILYQVIPQLRQGLAQMRARSDLPHCVENPLTGEVIDALDGETDRLLDQMERLALHVLGLPVPVGQA